VSCSLDIRTDADGVLFKVWVQPRASKNQVVGLYGDCLKVKLTAPPVEGAANKECVAFLAKQLGIARSRVQIISGQTGRKKMVRVTGVDKDRILSLLDSL